MEVVEVHDRTYCDYSVHLVEIAQYAIPEDVIVQLLSSLADSIHIKLG